MKKISWLLLITWLLFSVSTYAMNHNGMWNMWNWTGSWMMWSLEMMKSCPTYQNMTEEEKVKFESMTQEERRTYMQSKMGTWAMMWSGRMMGNMKHLMMWSWVKMWSGASMNWYMNSNNKAYTKLHDTLNKFFEKLDKEVTDDAKKIETLKKINTKIDTILTDSSLSQAKITVYNHIKHLIKLKINEIETTDVDLDWLLQIN